MLGWASAGGVLMLWGFFDESGEHDRQTGELTRLTLGGCWASFEQWETLSLNWATALEIGGIKVFHMTDFEANEGEFKGWRQRPDNRKRLLNSLLDAMVEFVPEYVGFSIKVPNGSAGFKKAYEQNLISMLDNTSFHDQPS
jgi:hypothetical protein